MSLTAALNSAKMSLSANAKQTSVSARNVAGASDPNYSRKLAPLITVPGGVRATGPQRVVDVLLYNRLVGATSVSERESVLLEGLTRLSDTVGDTQGGHSLVARIGDVASALSAYANAPADDNLAREAISKAKDLAEGLNEAAKVVKEVHDNANADLKASVDNINTKLAEFEQLNTRIVRGTVTGVDVTDDLDRRDAIVKELSSELGVSTMTRANNDLVLYTDSGVTLFETSARQVVLTPVPSPAGENQLFIDGVQVTGAGSSMPLKEGKVVGLVELRDDIAGEYAKQLDEVALGLITAFKETDPATTPTLPDVAGLFVNSAAEPPATPVDIPPVAPASAKAGWLASSIIVNSAVDPAKSGDPTKLRDGINPGYDYNPDSYPSFGDHLTGLGESLQSDLNAGGKTVLDYAASTVSWVESQRQASDSANVYNNAMVQQLTMALSNARGVDLNDETALQLELERSFAASAQLISVVDRMFQSLLDAIR